MSQIASIRARLGLTQAALAGELGIGQSAVSQYENGHVEPSPAVARRLIEIASRMGVNITYDEIYCGATPEQGAPHD